MNRQRRPSFFETRLGAVATLFARTKSVREIEKILRQGDLESHSFPTRRMLETETGSMESRPAELRIVPASTPIYDVADHR